MTVDPITLLMRGREVLAEQPFSRLLGCLLYTSDAADE